jgi:hypothetical protein
MEGEFRYQSPGFPNVRLPKVVSGVAISPEEWARVLAGEKVLHDGFYSKDKKKRFQAALVFNRDEQKIEFDFGAVDHDQASPQTLKLLCPKNQPSGFGKRIALGHTIEFRSVFVKEIFPVKESIRHGPFALYRCWAFPWLRRITISFLGIDLSDLLET